ncbi:uncharacterized protein LOC110817574 [Carica papaya]|uniref:uncharacterized protein LOC110817574 n=1 Tax=Carica papaya TaxID=3649 RepID=UPI000B8CB4AE|nr:uncharacterized protein LOC110817574 [Carica papaya]
MGRIGCNINGNLDDTKFSEPMPWIGIYVAAASLTCAAAMGADVIHCFHHRKLWFPCKFFSLNSVSLTLIGVAIKLSVDLNTSMPRCQDQLAKLSSSVFICTIMGNSMPSLGIMENTELFSNIIALGILVITVVVNVGIQLGTGVIYIFWKEHAFIMFIMLVMLLILSFSALPVPTTKHYLEKKYKKKHEIAQKESLSETDTIALEKLKKNLMEYCMMAHTSSPQFVMGRSVTCIASGAFSLLAAITLAEAMLRSYLVRDSFKFCIGESDYKWSTTVVLIIQTIAVVVGTIAPALRWLLAINFRCASRGKQIRKVKLKVEHYWIQSLVEMKEKSLGLRIQNRHCRKLVHETKNLILDLCIAIQSGIVIVSKLITCISICMIAQILVCFDFCKQLKKFIPQNSIMNNESGSESSTSTKLDLGRFVLHLEGEDQLVELMMKNNRDATDHRIRMGKRKQPKHLIKLLEKAAFSNGFQGIKEFDSDEVPSLDSEEPPNCWALPVVTLTSIAVALPDINPYLKKQLLLGVNEGLTYIRLVEKNLDTGRKLRNITRTADFVWLGVDLYHKWLDVDLHKLALQRRSPKDTLEELADNAKNRLLEFNRPTVNGCWKESASKWPIKVLAANSMYRISKTLLLNEESRNYQMSKSLFEGLVIMMSHIISACLSNLQRVIYNKCLTTSIEEREESVRHAAFHLGETDKILKILEQKTFPKLDPDQMACIDQWRLSYKLENPQSYSLPSKSDMFSSGISDLCLSVE